MVPPVGPPLASKELLEWLERTFPATMPALDEPDRSIWYRTGQADLIKTLRHHYDRAASPTNITGG
ncbi:hypothetical protein [Caudoviricetes sp.]|nr:hypothetical protein [Caudoviricetes sp.]